MNLADLVAETLRDNDRAARGVCIYCGRTQREHNNPLEHAYWNGTN